MLMLENKSDPPVRIAGLYPFASLDTQGMTWCSAKFYRFKRATITRAPCYWLKSPMLARFALFESNKPFTSSLECPNVV